MASRAGPAPKRPRHRVVCIGGANIDRAWRLVAPAAMGASNPARARAHVGGVARNVAENLARLGLGVRLVARVGDDPEGDRILAVTAAAGVDVSGIAKTGRLPTGGYVAVLGAEGELVIGLADTAAVEAMGPGDIGRERPAIADAALAFADTNLGEAALGAVAGLCAELGRPLALDLVSPQKAGRAAPHLAGLALVTGNRASAAALVGAATPEALALALVARGAVRAIVTCGAAGIVHADAAGARSFPAPRGAVVDVTGAGDALTAGAIAALLDGSDAEALCAAALEAARLTLAVDGPVNPALDAAALARPRQPSPA